MGKIFDTKLFAKKAREVIGEGVVLLKNDHQTLPLAQDTRIALFGRSQFNYYKSGTGSGGLVNTSYVTGVLEAIEQEEHLHLNTSLKKTYEEWLADHPFDEGQGWAQEPWYQEEMPITEELVAQAKAESDVAVVILGRTAGEDKDNVAKPGSYYLTTDEEHMLEVVCTAFEKTIVLLNVGNIVDMNWVDVYQPQSVLYIWQGGQEGGSGVVDVLTGRVTPSGKLPDTIAYHIEDYASTKNHGNEAYNIYEEDIYVGYRYFESFAPEKVKYPFGFGLSYTSFVIEPMQLEAQLPKVRALVRVTNTGSYAGKEVVQLYCKKPQGTLGQPAKVLVGFAKTRCLQPGESEELLISASPYVLASYDDSGASGYKSCYVYEAGEYGFYVGSDVRTVTEAGTIEVEETFIQEQLQEAMAPTRHFQRIKPAMDKALTMGEALVMEDVPTRTISPIERRAANIPVEIPYVGNQGYKLADVAEGRVELDTFIGQLSDEDLTCIVRGEGMCSSKVTPGTASAFGGVTASLLEYGIPIACCSDGPSGIRMDCGTIAFSMPGGAIMASTFNDTLIEELLEFEGLELRKNQIDCLLGPGINIHRNPLNGRNFEYFSEDPLLTGKMAAAQLRGMHRYGVTGAIKHFAANSQEYCRHSVESVVSERALREIYLKAFEIAVKEGDAYAIMTSYNPINGLWCASNYDLATTILRDEWGYEGLVMTDWWAKCNDEGEAGDLKNFAAMVRSQNDVYMVVFDSASNSSDDNSMEALQKGTVTRAEYQRAARNLCKVLMKTPAFLRLRGIETDLDKALKECLTESDAAATEIKVQEVSKESYFDVAQISTGKGNATMYQVLVDERGLYQMEIVCRSTVESDLAQIPLSVFQEKRLIRTITITGKDRDWQTITIDLDPVTLQWFYLKFFFGSGGMELKSVRILLKETKEDELRKIKESL